jgi:rhamnogalacturonyl hydrolase YesR
VWHGFDADTQTHSCCKWGDGNGWLFMGMADAVRAFILAGHTASPMYVTVNHD